MVTKLLYVLKPDKLIGDGMALLSWLPTITLIFCNTKLLYYKVHAIGIEPCGKWNPHGSSCNNPTMVIAAVAYEGFDCWLFWIGETMLQETEIKERLKKYEDQLIATEEGTDAELVLVTTIEVLERILELGE